uniref:Uncharacterized protein n=1 Tax=Rhizophora mucronata TaxID=61149 RepID=A0A2P2QZ00_RHIMU
MQLQFTTCWLETTFKKLVRGINNLKPNANTCSIISVESFACLLSL